MERERPAPACRLDVFDTAQRARHAAVLASLRAATAETRELPDGVAYRLAADPGTFVEAAEWITLERLCCPFLDFRLEWKRGEAWVSLTGGPEVKAFLSAG